MRSPWSIFSSNWFPWILTSVMFLPRAHWSWGRDERRRPGNKIHHRSRFRCDSLFSWILLRSFRHCIRTNCRTEMANIEPTQQMISLITREISFGQNVSELVFGVDVFDLDLGIQINSIKQPIKSNSVGPGNMSHCRTPAFNDHFDHCFIVFKHIQQNFLMRRLDVWRNRINILDLNLPWYFWYLSTSTLTGRPVLSEIWDTLPKTETIRSHSSRAGKPSNLSPVSKEMGSDSVELCETAVCFLHIQLLGTNVWLPKMHNVPPEVDFESSRSPAKSESWNSSSLHCSAALPTRRYCLYSHVWWICEINRFRRCHRLFPFLVYRCLCAWNFHGLVHRNKFVNQIVML